MAPSQPSTEARELELLKKVEFRFAIAETDNKLQTLLGTYLAPLLLKLGSEHDTVRQKVIEICQHVNIRLQSPSIKLPVEALLKQAKSNRTSTMLRNFDLTYIQKGIPRLDSSEKTALLPLVINGIKQDFDTSADFGSEVLNLYFRLLQDFQIPERGSKDDVELRKSLDLTEEDAIFIAEWIGKLTLLKRISTLAPTCPGLTLDEIRVLSLYGKRDAFDPTTPNGLNIVATQTKAVAFLATNAFEDSERFIPAVCAAGSTNSNISDVADGILKRSASAVDLENPQILTRLYELYFGGISTTTAGSLAPVPVRIKVLSYLSKSSTVINDTSMLERLIDGGLYVGGAPGKDTSDSTKAPSRELSLLRLATVRFVNSAIQAASQRGLSLDTQQLVKRFLSILVSQGWPNLRDFREVDFRQQAYQVIGSAAAVGKLWDTDLDMLQFLMWSYVADNSGQETALQIQRALLTMMRAFESDKTDASMKDKLARILLTVSQVKVGDTVSNSEIFDRINALAGLDESEAHGNMDIDSHDQSPRAVRSPLYIANRYANRCLPYQNFLARWLNILAVGAGSEARPETIDEGRRGLNPYWFETANADSQRATKAELPSLSEFVRNASEQLQSQSRNAVDMDIDQKEVSLQPKNFVAILRSHRKASMVPLVKYLRQLLVLEALESTSHKADFADLDWSRKLDSVLESSKAAKDAVRTHLEQSWSHSIEEQYPLHVLYELLSDVALNDEENVASDSIQTFTQFLTMAPDNMLCEVADFRLSLVPSPNDSRLSVATRSNNRPRREAAAHAFGLLFSLKLDGRDRLVNSDTLTSIVQSWQAAVGARINEIHGFVTAVSYVISRMTYRGKGSEVQDLYESFLKLLAELIQEAKDATLKDAAFVAIIQLSAYKVMTPSAVSEHMTIENLVEKLSEAAKKGNEAAITALGRFCLIFDDVDDDKDASSLEKVENAIYALHEIREIESQFAVGEALSILACGWESSALAPTLDIGGPLPTTTNRTSVLERVISRVISDSKTTKPSLKRASVIWLLCIVQFCGHREEVKGRLRAFQDAFKHCLSDKEELVQEAASRGLGLVYEKGDRALKDDLVRDLVGSFTDNKGSLTGNVTADTELFEPGALPTGEGKSVSTYKDVISLAQEVGDPSLVYRFMSLATNNSIWSSRAAFGRFGLSAIFSDSSVDGYLSENPKLYPKLFRYRFDPNPNVRRSMQDIWNALIKDSNATIDRNFDAIIDDLLRNMLGKEWRVRQASCDATADLIQGRPFEKVEPYIGKIWTQCFKVLDDIKGSVRDAAASLARTMTGILVRTLEAGESSAKKADAMLKHVIPFLFSSSGLESSAEDVMFVSIDTLLQVIKKSSGKVLRPYIPDIVERLLNLFSSMEPQIVNYLRFKAKEYKFTEQELDDKRLLAVRQSPLMEAVERCLDLLDDATMASVAPRLENAIKTALGLPSQVACTRVLVTMSTRHNQVFRPYADRFLKITTKHFTDRNDTVAVSYAEAAGYVSRVASDSQILELFETVKRLYFESEDDKPRIAAGDVVFAIAKHSTDRFSSLGSEIYPLVFVGKQDSDTHVKEMFEKTWSDNVGVSRAVLLYLKEIVQLSQAHLDSPRWALKHASARAIAAATDAATSGTENMGLADAEVLWPALVKATGGKTWDGKEVVLEAFVKFVQKGSKLWSAQSKVASEITKIITREAKRQNIQYRPFAISGLGKVAAARTDTSMVDTVFDIVGPVVDELASDETDEMDVDGASEAKMTSDLYAHLHQP